MHVEALIWGRKIVDALDLDPKFVLDLGGRDNNGTFRDFFPSASFMVVDVEPGPDVNVVADAAEYEPLKIYSVALCTEVFEHTSKWPQIIRTMSKALLPSGVAIITAGTDPRRPHGALDGHYLEPGEEYYENVDPVQLRWALKEAGFGPIFIETRLTGREPGDVYCFAVKR